MKFFEYHKYIFAIPACVRITVVRRTPDEVNFTVLPAVKNYGHKRVTADGPSAGILE